MTELAIIPVMEISLLILPQPPRSDCKLSWVHKFRDVQYNIMVMKSTCSMPVGTSIC